MLITENPIKTIKEMAIFIGIASGVGTIAHYPKEIYDYFEPVFSKTPTNAELYGSWSSNYGYPVKEGNVHVDGMVNYFKTGDYNFSGTVDVTGYKDNHSLTLSYVVNGAGAWSADRDSLLIKLQDTKSSIQSVDYDARLMDPRIIEALSQKKLPEFSDFMPKGIADEFQIVHITHDTITLKARDPLGQIFTVTMTRVSDSLASR